MPRLTSLPGRLAPQTGRLAPAPASASRADKERARNLDRAQGKPWRKWYGLKRWAVIRRDVFNRAGGICEQTGIALVGPAGAPDSPVADHKIGHNGDPGLFWDIDNVQCVSKQWHDGEKQRIERRQRG